MPTAATTLRRESASNARERIPARERRRIALITGLGILLIVSFIGAICIGSMRIHPMDIIGALIGDKPLGAAEQAVLFAIRLPRAAAGLLVGIVLGLCGAAMQGLFRNPLADPGLVGVTSGAALGSVLYLKFAATALAAVSLWLGQFALPVAALTGGLLATVLMHRASLVDGRTVVALMLLAGIALNALGGAATGLVLFFADDDQLRQFTFWTLGNLGHATWSKLLAALPFVLPALFLIPRHAGSLNALLLGEAEAGHLGIDLQRLKVVLIFATAAGVGAAVSVAGGIGFIGLVVPHLIRQLIGPDHRWLIPGSALLGGALLLLADLLSRTLATPAELPVGVVTAAIGAPVFFSLLRSHRKEVAP